MCQKQMETKSERNHSRHHALEVWWIVYKFHIPQKLYVLQMSGTDIHKQQYVPTLHTNEDIQYP